jgi:hypothetical protein
MNLIYEGLETQQLSDAIDKSPTRKLLQELNFKYGLKVIDYTPPDTKMYTPQELFIVADPSGFAVARVWTYREDNYDVYCYRSPFYRKDRGSDSADRETIHSKKLSTLMATLKRNNVVPPSSGMLSKHPTENFNQAMGFIDAYHGKDYKNNNFSANEIHTMLKVILLGESPNELNINNCKEALDKWNEQDRIRVEKRKNIDRFFNNEFYAIGADKLNHLVIGSVKRMYQINKDVTSYEVVKAFKRVTELPDELKAVMLMNKVHAEGKNVTKFHANIVPSESGYNPDLDLINVATRHVDEFHLAWTLVPCSSGI